MSTTTKRTTREDALKLLDPQKITSMQARAAFYEDSRRNGRGRTKRVYVVR